MASSAINSQIWNAKAANVQNYDGSPIVASGAWNFRNSTGVVTFAMSDAGNASIPQKITVGASYTTEGYTVEDISVINGIKGHLCRNNANNAAATAETIWSAYGNSWSIGMGSSTYATYGNSLVIRGDALVGGARTVMAYCTTSGAWTLGPAASSATNLTINGNARIRAATSTNDNAYLYISRQDDNSSVRFGANFAAGVSSGKFFADATEVGGFNNAGAWTLGPVAGEAVHTIGNGSGTIAQPMVYFRKRGANINTNNNLYAAFSGANGDDGYIQTNGSGVLSVVDVASDERLKENIREGMFGLADILKLRPITYDWKDGSNKDVKGFIAQEVQTVLPESVMENPNGFLSMEMQTMIPLLVRAIQEQQAQIDALRLLIKGV